MRCTAKVGPSIRYRTDRGTEPRCRRRGRWRIDGEVYCTQHGGEAVAAHLRVLARIRAIHLHE